MRISQIVRAETLVPVVLVRSKSGGRYYGPFYSEVEAAVYAWFSWGSPDLKGGERDRIESVTSFVYFSHVDGDYAMWLEEGGRAIPPSRMPLKGPLVDYFNENRNRVVRLTPAMLSKAIKNAPADPENHAVFRDSMGRAFDVADYLWGP